eukprot:TRINITY_DN7873_c0_g8_i2.p1 TRINITY_DN7873_c0_g8~~TRINITY_DN7873_c0_g8_i2.p1  ORF type:complete len:299 (-),score=113.48 TRINITY_DN7873_c0_g8_i2:137-1033(-)
MKFELGSQYISKYVQMHMDIESSKEHTEQFHKGQHGGTVKGVELTVRVLTSGLWGDEHVPDVRLPPQLFSCCEAFESFYKQIHVGRHLVWNGMLGDCEVVTSGFNKKYILVVTAYQATVLSLYNDRSVYTFQELINETKLPAGILGQQMFNLANPRMGKLLVKENIKTPVFNKDEKIKLNNDFTFGSLKLILLPQLVKTKIEVEPNKKYEEEVKNITKQRETVLQATIMKIMKRRKEEKHNDLIAEVIKMIRSFKPDPVMIKQQIEWLIEKDYIMRLKDDKYSLPLNFLGVNMCICPD